MVRAPFVYSHLLLEVWRQQKKKKIRMWPTENHPTSAKLMHE